jgi:hypothetical protein
MMANMESNRHGLERITQRIYTLRDLTNVGDEPDNEPMPKIAGGEGAAAI